VPFPPVAARFERLEEARRIYQQMGRGDETPFEGRYNQLARPLNSPAPLRTPYPPIMIGGGGEKKTLRLVAKYADACNLFNTPDVEHKLEVLRGHCEREGRDYDEILKTALYVPDVGAKGERGRDRGPERVDQLRGQRRQRGRTGRAEQYRLPDGRRGRLVDAQVQGADRAAGMACQHVVRLRRCGHRGDLDDGTEHRHDRG